MAGKYTKMKMPSSGKDPMFELEIGGEAPEAEASESSEDSMPAEDITAEEGPMANPALQKASDDELLAELKKRGFDVEEPEPAPGPDKKEGSSPVPLTGKQPKTAMA